MRKICLCAFCVILSVLSGQSALIPDMKFRRLDTRDGLSNSQVNRMLRDSRGFLWFATPYGLNRYDGYRFRTFFSYEKDTTTLRSNRVDDIQEAHDGRLWMRQSMGYAVYDPTTEKVDRSPGRWLNKQGIKGGLEYLHIDSKKNYWVKTYDDGFYYYNPQSKKINHFHFGYGPTEFSKEFGIAACTESAEGLILVSTYGELMCIDGEQGRVLWKEDFVKRALDAYNDYWVTVDKEQNIWVITHTVGTYIYAKKEKRWYTTLTDYMRTQGFQDVPDEILVWEVCYDNKGLLWVATDHLGVLVLDSQNKTWRQFSFVKGDDTSLPDITAKHLYVDQLGRIWIATYKNGVAMCSDALSNFASLAIGDINGITEDKQGYWWLGRNDGGIIRMDPKTHEQVETFTKQSLGVPSDVIVGEYASKDGSLWFGTYEGGLLKYQDGQWKNYRASDPGSKFMTNNIWGITEDKWGKIWIGVLGGGVVRLDPKSGVQRSFTADNSKLKTVWTNSITTATSGHILVGNSEYYALINPGNFSIVNDSIPQGANQHTISAATSHAVMDSRGLIWLCSPTGVTIYDRKTQQSTLLDMKTGLYGSNAVSVTEDSRHTMWVATDHGVSNIMPQRQEDGSWSFTVRSFNDGDGLQPGPFNQRAIYCTRAGELLIGGQDGLDIINTLKLDNGDKKERPVFSGLELFNREIEVGEKVNGRVLLKEALDIVRSISLRYSENQFTIQMGSDNGAAKNPKRFIYQLKGFSDVWIKTSPVNPNITYMSLPSGSYTLCVRMLNDDGTMGETESQLDIYIASPWYRSWWALAFYLLAGFGLWYYRKRLAGWWRRLKERRKTKAAKQADDEAIVPTSQVSPQKEEPEVEEAVLMDDDDDGGNVVFVE